MRVAGDLGHPDAPPVVGADHCALGAHRGVGGEQPTLGVEVVVEILVEVEVILRQVGECPIENRTDAVDPAQRQRVTRHSLTTVSMPRSRIAANSACNCGASGVVRALGTRCPPTRVSIVPTRPIVCPAAARPASTRYDVVVFPECR